MSRKFAASAAMMLVVALSVTGLTLADDDSPLAKQMNGINAKTGVIKKATKTAATWKKDAKPTVAAAEEIVKLGKEARKDTTSAEKTKKPQDDWTKLMDDMIKSAGDYATLAAKPDTTQAQAKDAFNTLNKSCSSCHAIFRVDDDK